MIFSFGAMMVGALFILIWMANSSALSLLHPSRSFTESMPDGTVWEQVEMVTSDGIRLTGWFAPPNDQGAAIILVHGLGSNRGELANEAELLVEHGFGALLINLRNHGTSQGEMTTLGYYEVRDVEAAFQYLLNRSEVNPDRIGLLGNSMGAIVVIRSAARIPEIGAIVAQSGLTSIEDNIGRSFKAMTGLPEFPFAPLVILIGERRSGVAIDQVRPIEDVGKLQSQAILFVHGEADEIVPFQNSLRLYEAAQEPKELYIVRGAGHGGLLAADPARYESTVVGFFEEYLRED
jgi:dipeptidyl aminopeptidase/acylaminoacyl peptidase